MVERYFAAGNVAKVIRIAAHTASTLGYGIAECEQSIWAVPRAASAGRRKAIGEKRKGTTVYTTKNVAEAEKKADDAASLSERLNWARMDQSDTLIRSRVQGKRGVGEIVGRSSVTRQKSGKA